MLLAVYFNGEFAYEREYESVPVLPLKPFIKFYRVENKESPPFDPKRQTLTGPKIVDDHAAGVRRYVWTLEDKPDEGLDAEERKRQNKVDTADPMLTRLAFHAYNSIMALEAVTYQLWCKAQEAEGKKPNISEFRLMLKEMPGTVNPHQFEELMRSYLP